MLFADHPKETWPDENGYTAFASIPCRGQSGTAVGDGFMHVDKCHEHTLQVGLLPVANVMLCAAHYFLMLCFSKT